MPEFAIHTICVCGAGTMGSGIAQVAATAGYNTVLFDVNEGMLAKGKATIEAALTRLAGKGKITPAGKQLALHHLSFTANIDDCKADLIIEAIVEDKDAKTALFNKLASVNNTQTIFATNTSSLSVKHIAEETEGPQRVVGVHFFNPAPVMKLVEVVKTPFSSEAVISSVMNVAQQMGKVAVVCSDSPGFIVNRVARNYYLEALRMVELGLADIETIDAVMEAAGFKMGPFRLMDLIGIDVNYSVSNIVWQALGKPARLTPSVLQKQKVEAGELGKKTEKGFYVG
ncbi:MAG TPA: 3-hydroxyacyl-CoA dehydrogenase NAD-binding domain-containing protein [Chitinophagaceae bacterium]|nr:3-hydroxyacyl-CoA dehydrogenase NAD-binding domain-containing protein [Chitinophagaceae bacterium]